MKVKRQGKLWIVTVAINSKPEEFASRKNMLQALNLAMTAKQQAEWRS